MSQTKSSRNLITLTLTEETLEQFKIFHLKYINETGDIGMHKATLIKLALMCVMNDPKGVKLLKQTKRQILLAKKKK